MKAAQVGGVRDSVYGTHRDMEDEKSVYLNSVFSSSFFL